MPRQARKKSESGIYHIILRGIDRQLLFQEREDYIKFLQVVQDYRAICGYEIFAYCLMSNHVHLLMKFPKESMEQAFKRICGRFVYWYNLKYDRVGHLFQDRFKSEPIDEDRYFLACIRYIHQNPVKAGIAQIHEYPYSSYKAYIGETTAIAVDTDFLFSLVEPAAFQEFSLTMGQETILEVAQVPMNRMTDEKALALLQKTSKCKSTEEFRGLTKERKRKYIQRLKEHGLGLRQISRITGESYYNVREA